MEAARTEASCPLVTSCLISRPSTKKNRVISPSFTQWRRSSSRLWPARLMPSSDAHSSV